MPLLQKILHKLNGLHYGQEYLCLAKETMQQPLYVYITSGNNTVEKDITNNHLFIGYSPLIFAIFETGNTQIQGNNQVKIIFSTAPASPGTPAGKKNILASLVMKKTGEHLTAGMAIYYYEGVKGSHKFLPPFNTVIFQLNNYLFNKKSGNVFLKGNLYRQVLLAYSLPRKISVVTVGHGNRFNLFPTDLHGQTGGYYIISLRSDGKACRQVETAKEIVLSDMHVSAYKQVYALGKNHMQELKEMAAFDFSDQQSKEFELPLPQNILRYKELVLESSTIQGIHTLLLFRVVYAEEVVKNDATLSHIHNAYATWRYKNHIATEYYYR